jgi:1-deoxy-D-xylulose-5-phosphate synthase
MGATIDLCLKSRERAIEEGVPAPSVMDLRCAKPLDWTTLDKTLQKDNLVIILEEGYKFGGVGEAIASRSAEFAFKARVLPLGIPDLFVPHGTPAIQREYCGLTYQRVVNCYKEEAQRKSR